MSNISVSSGTVAANTVLTSGQSMNIQSGGSAEYTTVNSGGKVYVSSSANANSTCINSSGLMHVYSGGNVSNTMINPFGRIYVSKGGRAVNTTINSGGNMTIYNSGSADSTAVNSGGYLYIASGGNATSASAGNGGKIVVSKSGIANNATVNSGGSMQIYSGGNANYTTVNSGGRLNISSGANVLEIKENGGYINIGGNANVTFASHTVSNLDLTGAMTVHQNTIADSTVIHDSGLLDIYSGGFASNTAVNSDGTMQIFSGGTAAATAVNYGGYLLVEQGGLAVETVLSGGSSYYNRPEMHISNGGTASRVTAGSGAAIYVYSGGTAWGVVENGGFISVANSANVTFASNTVNRLTLSNTSMTVHSNTIAHETAVNASSYMYVYSGGTVDRTSVAVLGYMYISSGGAASASTVGGYMTIFSGGMHRGSLQIDSGAVVSAHSGAVVDFTLVGKTASDGYLINNLALIQGVPTYTVTVSATQANGTYKLAQGAANFTGSVTIGNGSVNYGSITVNGDDFVYNGVTYSLDQINGNLTLTVSGATSGISNLQASATGASWSGNAETVEYSQDNFATSLKLNTSGSAIDTFQTPAGAWQVRVDADAQTGFTAASPGTTPAQLVSDADGDMDVFFAKTNGTWQGKNIAKHAGNLNGWTGTHERAAISGKNKIEDIFAGSTDANVLVLTDNTNGDALFLDDIYSTFGSQARLSQIDEIRAGAGDDVVDLTSPKFAYLGDEMTVFGGAGDDTIWANSGVNTLYGDAGNDRIIGGAGNDFIIGGAGNDSMHGGGGNDTFCFGANWGTDTVEQLATGKVILRFETGSLANWNATTQTYTSGSNSVTVTGTSDIELYFGADSTLPAGAFLSASSDKIFEDINSGMLA